MIRKNEKYSRPQTVLSLIILSILVIIGMGVVVAQNRFNPAILKKEDLLPAADADRQAPPASAIEAFAPLPPSLKPLTAPEMFDATSLSDKINGKAELYLSAGFNGLVSQRFRDAAASDIWLEAFVYDMGNGQNAFAVFSTQRRENAESLDFSQYAYKSPNAVFLVHGKYYLELIASLASAQVTQLMETLAVTFIRNTQSDTVSIAEQDLFPKSNLVADSISLITADAFGYEQFNQIYTAEYQISQNSLMAYLSRRQTTGEAQKLAVSYGKFLLNFGGQKLDRQISINNAQLIEILDTYEIIFSFGPYLAGVREATTPDQAATLALQLFNQLKEIAGDT